MQSEGVISTYKPFKYPPDYSLARIHQKSSMPGKEDPLQLTCPCCDQSIKKPFPSWWGRSIEKDFKQYGGAIICYFWLLKLYCVAIILVIACYGIYLQYLTWHYCEQLLDEVLKKQVCSSLFGVWIITNEDLYDLIDKVGDKEVLIRFSVLRSVVFVILLATNAISLYLMKYYKTRYPEKTEVSQFSLLFKNVQTQNVEELLSALRKEFGNFQIQEAVLMKHLEPFSSAYRQKIEIYYQLKHEKKEKKIEKMKKRILKLDELCGQHEGDLEKGAGRVIIVFQSLKIRQQIMQKYSINGIKKTWMLLKHLGDQGDRIFCQECPRPDEIIWKNLGTNDRLQLKLIFKALFLYFIILCFTLVMLYGLSRLIYFDSLKGSIKSIVVNVILLGVVFISIGWRLTMDKISDSRKPYTYTKRVMFIVITTVMLHFVFYLWIPSTYLNFYHDFRGPILNLVSNQAFTTVVVQMILAAFDLFFCCWNSSKKKIEDEDNPYACQRILHQKMEYPPFPFIFKTIVLYKFWSLITFFAYHVPMVLFLILIALSFLLVKDKFNLYFHYRAELIRNEVQYKFLKIYTCVFTIYMYIIFVHTQKANIEYIIGAILTALALIVQIFCFKDTKSGNQDQDDVTVQLLSQINPSSRSHYQDKYQLFIQTMRSDSLDIEIKNYLSNCSLIDSSINDLNDENEKNE